jgi:hypothetical protein
MLVSETNAKLHDSSGIKDEEDGCLAEGISSRPSDKSTVYRTVSQAAVNDRVSGTTVSQ